MFLYIDHHSNTKEISSTAYGSLLREPLPENTCILPVENLLLNVDSGI